MKSKQPTKFLRYLLDNDLEIDKEWVNDNFLRKQYNWVRQYKKKKLFSLMSQQSQTILHQFDGNETAEDQFDRNEQKLKYYLCLRSNKNCHKKCSHPLNPQYEAIFQFGSILADWGYTNPSNLYLFFEDLKQQKLLQKYSFRELLGCLNFNFQRIYACCYAFFKPEELKQRNVYYIQKWVREKQEGNQDLKFYEYGSTIIQKTLEILTKQFFKEVTINEIKQQLFYSIFGLFAWNPYQFQELQFFDLSVIFCALILKFKLDITSEVIVQSATYMGNLRKCSVNYLLMLTDLNKQNVEGDLKKKL